MKKSGRQLKQECLENDIDINSCVEKVDFVFKLLPIYQRKQQQKEQRKKEKEAEELNDRIVAEVAAWSKSRNIKVMLNEVMGYQPNHEHYIKKTDGLPVVTKVYKKSLLKIHPDKHMSDPAAHIRATEVFKYINEEYQKYKKEQEEEEQWEKDLWKPKEKEREKEKKDGYDKKEKEKEKEKAASSRYKRTYSSGFTMGGSFGQGGYGNHTNKENHYGSSTHRTKPGGTSSNSSNSSNNSSTGRSGTTSSGTTSSNSFESHYEAAYAKFEKMYAKFQKQAKQRF